jgi:hypothetical protein
LGDELVLEVAAHVLVCMDGRGLRLLREAERG